MLSWVASGTLVSTLAVEWIEIAYATIYVLTNEVSTLAVEWIEIPYLEKFTYTDSGLHPRGGVD